MADRPTITVDVNGEQVETELPDGFISQDEVSDKYVPRSAVDAEARKKAKEMKGDMSRELMESDDFVSRLVEFRGEDIREMLGVEEKDQPSEPDLDRIRQQIEEQSVAPLKEELDSLQEERSMLRQRALDAEIREAMDEVGVVDDNDTRDLVPYWIRERVAWDEEHNRYVVLDDKGEVKYSSDGPMGVKDLLIEENKAGRHKGWFKDPGRSGAGFNGSRGGSGPVTLKQFEAMSSTERSQLYRQNPDLYSRLMTEKRRKAEDGLRNPAMAGE